jgi:pimeloyl-ACP methyl ester carboxylesterase/class 3 adenylate cyclase/DNA-binding CsgD family transcriptional regulator
VRPEMQYARRGDVHIAYQVLGNGPLDLVSVPGWISHVEYDWELPAYQRFHERFASFSRLIRFDKRGTGLSDRVSITELPSLEQRIDDMRAVMDAVGSERAVLMGSSEGAPLAILFAATYPERTVALVLWGAMARSTPVPDYPWGSWPSDLKEREELFDSRMRVWGTMDELMAFSPELKGDERYLEWASTRRRLGASPGAALALLRMNVEIDVRHVLPAIRVPTLIMHRTDDQSVPVGGGRYIAAHIPGSKYVELPGADHHQWLGDQDVMIGAIEEFLTGSRHVADSNRVLATVMSVGIADAMSHITTLGDRRWRELLHEYQDRARREVTRFRGHPVRVTGEGTLATFDGPARAVQCARAIGDAARELGIATRAGLHTGEVDVVDDEIDGITVQVAARIGAMAGPDEVLVSGTVRDLVAGSGLAFEERGALAVPGVPHEWRLSALASEHQALSAPPQPPSPWATATRMSPGEPPGRGASLTAREREVAGLIGQGCSNRRIAEALVIAEKTAEVHARNVREKLGLETRAQIAAWATRHGLVAPET